MNLSAENAATVAERQVALGRGLPEGLFRFGEADQAHVTLRFLGPRTAAEQTSIGRAAAGVATRVRPFSLTFAGVGFFPDARRPHTLWMGLAEGRDELVALAAELEAALATVGVAPEGRPFVPHLTLARIKGRLPTGLAKKLLEDSTEPTGAQQVDSFALMESRPTPQGVRYVPLQVFPLESTCTPFE
ncbi:MAG: RNA 2',3'-cyclic phosphodiesterase [Polyangiaceae bacterium]